LAEPQTGVVTCPYSGRPLAGLWSQLAAMQVTYQFLPNVVTGVSLGLAQPCMGSTIALRREVLDRIGGFAPFADLLADDYAIGEAVRAAGCRSAVLPVLVEHGCAERTLGELVAHELRWARTIRGIDPGGFFGSVVTHAFVWALVGVVLTAATPVSLVVLAIALAARLWMMRQAAIVTQPKHQPWWLAPVRDILSFAVFLGSFFVRTVEWRGNRFRVDPEGGLSRA
jgi:ceramide glucosyltransferase